MQVYVAVRLCCGVPDLPDIAEDEVDNDSHDGDHLEIQLRGDFKIEPLGEIFRLVERHEDDGRAGRHCPGPHDDWKYFSLRLSTLDWIFAV